MFDSMPSYAFNFVRDVYSCKEVWFVANVEEKNEKCVLVRLVHPVCCREIDSPLTAVGAKFYMRMDSSLSSVGKSVLCKVTTDSRFGTEPLQAPSSEFTAVSSMSHCFELEFELGYTQLVLNMWRFAQVYERFMSTSRLVDIFTEFSQTLLSAGARRRCTNATNCARCTRPVDRSEDHFFRDDETAFCSECARFERYRRSLVTVETPYDLKYSVEECGVLATQFVVKWIESNLVSALERKMVITQPPICKAVYHDRVRQDVLIRFYEVEFDAVKLRDMPQLVPSIEENVKELKDVNLPVFQRNTLKVEVLDFGATIRSWSVVGPLITAFAATQCKTDWENIKETAFALLKCTVGGLSLNSLYAVSTSNTTNCSLKISHTGTCVGSDSYSLKAGERCLKVHQLWGPSFLIFSYFNRWSFLDVNDF